MIKVGLCRLQYCFLKLSTIVSKCATYKQMLVLKYVPVCYGEDCAALKLLPDGGLDEVVGLQVNGRRRLVQYEHLGRLL